METRVFSPSAYTFGEQRPRICRDEHSCDKEMSRGKKRKSESDKNEGANGTSSLAHLPGYKKRTKRTSIAKSQIASANNT